MSRVGAIAIGVGAALAPFALVWSFPVSAGPGGLHRGDLLRTRTPVFEPRGGELWEVVDFDGDRIEAKHLTWSGTRGAAFHELVRTGATVRCEHGKVGFGPWGWSTLRPPVLGRRTRPLTDR